MTDYENAMSTAREALNMATVPGLSAEVRKAWAQVANAAALTATAAIQKEASDVAIKTMAHTNRLLDEDAERDVLRSDRQRIRESR